LPSEEFGELVNQLRKGEIVLWVGSGLSLYAGYPTADDIVKTIMSKVPGEQRTFFKDQSLKEVAEQYEKLFNREKLNEILIELFQIEPQSLIFHKNFPLIPQLKTIITTNYDTLFEQIYKELLKVIVTNDDLVTSNHNKIQLLKIHGTIDKLDTIKITSSDYQIFFNEEQSRNPLWTEIKSICTKNSVLFIGYSLQDSDVIYVIFQILNQLKDSRKDIFFIAPKIPEHEIRDLSNKYNIKYIDKTGEELISELINEINRHLLEDFYLGNISIEDYQHSIKLRGIKSTITKDSSGNIFLDGRIESDSEKPTHIQYKIEDSNLRGKLQELLEGKSGTSFEISSEDSEGEVSFSIKDTGFQFPFSYDPHYRYHYTITRRPLKEYATTIRIKGTDIIFQNLPTKAYYLDEFLVSEITHPQFKLTIKLHQRIKAKSKFHITYQWDGSPIQSYNLMKMLYSWVTGSDMVLINLETGNIFTIPVTDVNLPRIETDRIKAIFKLLSDLIKIQDYFGIIFRKIVEIYEEDIRKIGFLLQIISGKKAFAEGITATLKSYDIALLSKILIEGAPVMEINGCEDVELFEQKMPIKSNAVINNAYIENSEFILQQIQKGINDIKIVIKSRSGRIPVIFNK